MKSHNETYRNYVRSENDIPILEDGNAVYRKGVFFDFIGNFNKQCLNKSFKILTK